MFFVVFFPHIRNQEMINAQLGTFLSTLVQFTERK